MMKFFFFWKGPAVPNLKIPENAPVLPWATYPPTNKAFLF